jgi:hypothetical protein
MAQNRHNIACHFEATMRQLYLFAATSLETLEKAMQKELGASTYLSVVSRQQEHA